MNRTMAKERVVNNGEVETRFAGKNLTLNLVQGMKLFHKFVQKLGVEEALGQRIKLTRREGNYKTGRVLVSLLYALALDLNRLLDTARLQRDKVFQILVGFDGYPHQSTFSRFLKLFSVSIAQEIGETSISLLSKVRNDLRTGPG